jgi:signal transduction histidine kinase/ActR/RegA family two-component response regulator
VRAVPIRTETGDVSTWIGTSTDIDDRKRAEEAIRLLADASTILASSLDYRATLAEVTRLAVPALGDWCVIDVVDDDGEAQRIAYVHEDVAKAELLRDLARRFPHGSGAETEVAPELVTDVDASYLQQIARDEVHLESLRKLGMRSCMTVPLVARGRKLGSLMLATSGSERRFTRADLTLVEDLARRAATAVDNALLYEIAQRERANLEEANRAKDEFLAMVSHELRTPLNSMLGWTQLLRTGKLDESMLRRAIETIERNAKSQAQIIADLLDVSRIVTGKLQLEIRPIELAPIVEAALDAVRPAIKAKSIELEISLDRSLEPIAGDPDRLQQVAWNLLSNAIKFTPAGGWIGVRLERVSGEAVLTVADSGIGIDDEFLPYVFDRFRQADASSTRAYGGLGLGLSIVRNLVDLHGGRIEALSEGKDKGATFRIWFPLTSAGVVRQASVGDEHDASSGALDGVRVLVVEDEPDGQEIFRLILEACGADVRVASCVPEALEAFGAEPPDVLLSDIGLPGESGYDLIRHVRSLEPERGGRVPSVALTAFASDADRRLALGAGFDHHLPKPVEPAALVALVRTLVASGNGLAAPVVSPGKAGAGSSLPSGGEG